MENDLFAHYELVSDIDCSETENWNNGKGFDPIGSYDNEFFGVLNGKGHEVKDLYINRGEESNVGLFGFIEHSAEVKEVGVTNVDVTGDGNVGGLVGIIMDGAVSSSFSTGSVSGSHYAIGGLVGDNGGSISSSFSTVDVSGDDRNGGLVGNNGGSISSSYSTGSVSGGNEIGGLVGFNNYGSISSSYSTGDVSGSGDVGGLIAYSYSGTVSDSYWDFESSGQPSSEKGTGLSTSEMQGSSAEGNMTGLDFTSTWGTREGDYPGLYWESDVFVPDDLQNPDWTFNGHTDDVLGVAVDGDGYVYSGSQDGTVRKIDPDGNEVWSFTGHTNRVQGVAVDSDGYVYSGSYDGTVRKVSPDGSEIWSFTGHTDTVDGVVVDSDGYVYSESYDGTVRKIDPDGNEFDSFSVDDDQTRGVGVSPVSNSKQYLAAGTGYSNFLVYRWSQDVSSGGGGSSDIAICDSRGPLNECVSNSSHNVSSGSFSISSFFQAESSAVFESLFGMATINVDNSTSLSGLWKGSFNISTSKDEKTTIRPGAEFKPENGRIIIGN